MGRLTAAAFDKLIVKSLGYPEKLYLPNSVYFGSEYAKGLDTILRNEGVIGKYHREFDLKKPRCKMLSASSSSRLCFLYSRDKNWELEANLKTGCGGVSQPDAWINNEYFECKCREIFESKHKLTVSYQKALSDKNLFNIETEILSKDRLLYPTLRQFGIDRDGDIYSFYFDIKQLICHLLGLSRIESPEIKKLNYVFFTPSEEVLFNNKELVDVYEELDKEIKLIWHSEIIKDMTKRNRIQLGDIIKVQVDTIEDIVTPDSE